ncbi:MAG: hypothetical protein II155_04425 [Clostridia bacterium]|nr:hypothetical protein [Clostridia bacterium]
MMKKLRIALLVFFIVVASVFAYTTIRRRMSVDYDAPAITAEEDVISVSIAATDEELLKGMKAYDKIDGDVTNTLFVVSKSKFVAKNTQQIRYAAFDSNKNVGTFTREVVYIDYVSPRFHLYAPLRYASGTTGIDYLENFSAEDCLDGNITNQMKITFGKVTAAGISATTQQLNIQVTNSGGDSSVLELTASMEDYLLFSQLAPALREYIAYVPKGGVIDLESYLVGVWSAGSNRSFADAKLSADNVFINKNGLNCSVPGRYDVIYQLRNNLGEDLGTATLIVIVEE